MSVALKNFRPLCGVSCKAFHTSRCLDDTHYETLKLEPSCTAKEIRSAFIKLSKQYHPDTNQTSVHAHSQFIKINEAYSVLSRPEKRQEYDCNLENVATVDRNWEVHSSAPGDKQWRDETIWHMRDQSEDGKFRHKPYYGIKGLGRLSNKWIVVACFVFTALGVSLQVVAIRSSFETSRTILDQRSEENSKMHQAARQRAEANGNHRQLQLLRQRLQASPVE